MSILTDGPDGLGERLQAALGTQYQLTGRLGVGGFGVVFAARDHALNREVAVKALRPEIAAPVVQERFRREAEAAARLQHPGIVPIFAVGEQAGLAWFVMPRIRGETLRDRLERQGRLPVAEARRILIETAEALEVAHAAGIVHRDIKPDNIMLDGSASRVVLTDFGIAKSLTLGADGRHLTTTGLVIGTPDYMSPEQASGEGTVDARSDVYSLGVVGFQLLTGKRPFAGRNPAAILMEQVGRPPASVTQRRPECPASIAVAVDRCLAVDPAARWGSMGEFLAAMRRDSRTFDVVTASARARDSVPALLRQSRITLAGVAGALVLAVAIDLARGVVLSVPLALLIAAGVLAARYGTLWVRGYGWREAVGRPARADPRTRRTTADEGGSFHPVAVQARSDRAAILRMIAQLPRAERERLPDLTAPIDESVARVEELARGLWTAQAERDDRRAAEAGQALTAAATPLGRLLVFVRENRRGGLTDRGEDLDALLAGLRPPGAGRPPPG